MQSSSNWFLDWFIDMISKNLGGSAGTHLFVSTTMGLYYFFSSNHTACLAEGALPTALVDTYFCLEMFKQELFGGRQGGKEQTGNTSSREGHWFTKHLTLNLKVNSNNKQQSLKNLKQENFLTMPFHQPIKTTEWYNFLDPIYIYMNCQISQNAWLKSL